MISQIISAIFKTKGVIGVDIGADSVKLSRITPSSHKIKVAECGSFPINIPEGASSADRISIISSEMRKFIKKRGIGCRNAVILLSGNDVRISYSLLDRMPEDNFKAACVKEAGRLFFNNEDLLIDYDTVGEVSEEGVPKVRVVFAAAKKETVSEKIIIAEQSGLEPLMVIPSVFAFERLFRMLSKIMSEGNHLVVQLGRLQTQMYVFSFGKAISVRNVSVGSKMIDEEIISLINSSREVSEEIKKRYSVPVSEEEKIAVLDRFSKEEAAAITAKKHYISALAAEIDPFVYLSDVKISDVFLVGGPAGDNAVSSFLEKNLGMPVKNLPVPDFLTKRGIKLLGADASMLMSASAASVSAGHHSGATEINMLPSGYEKSGRGIAMAVKISLYVIFAAMIAGIFAINGIQSSLKETIRGRNASRAAAAVQAAAPEIDALKIEEASLEEYTKQADGIRKNRLFSSGLIKDLAETLPQDVYISAMTVQPGEEGVLRVEIKAASKDGQAASQWIESISKKNGYENFVYGNSSKEMPSDGIYVVSASFEYKGGSK